MHASNRLLVAAAIAVPVAVLALAGVLNFKQIRAEAEREAQHTAAGLSEHALRTIRAHELILEFVDMQARQRSWEEIRSSAVMHGRLRRLMDQSRDVSSIFIVDAQGRVALSSRAFPMTPFDASDRDYFRALRDGDGLHISRPARGRMNDDRFFSVARRKTDDAGRFDGVLAVSVNPEYFESFYASLADHGAAASLLRADGVVLARYPTTPLTELPASSVFFSAIAAQPAAGSFATRSLTDGVERIVAYQRVGSHPLYTSYQVSMAGVWAHWRRATVPYALACLLALALLLAGAALAEQRVRRAAAEARSLEAEEASRAKDRFVAALSHELRNPLSAISAASEILGRAPLPDPVAAKASQIIGRQIAQLRRMLDDLLDTARAVYDKLNVEPRRVAMREVARAVVADRPKGEALIEVTGEEGWVNADPVRLRQMIDNLVENAERYGGRAIEARIRSQDEWVELSVHDDGRGIAPDLLPRLFQPFVQGPQSIERSQGGLGLGLALTERLARLHGGALTARSDGPGRGSVFTIRLPRSEPPARLVPPSSPVADERKLRFVVVEDEDDAREGLRALLALEGHEVIAAAEGLDGLAAIESARPDVALVDIGLPGIDGCELASRLRRLDHHRKLKLIAITGYGQPADRERARKAGFDAHLIKPFSYQDLLAAMEVAGKRRKDSTAA